MFELSTEGCELLYQGCDTATFIVESVMSERDLDPFELIAIIEEQYGVPIINL